MPLWSPFLVYYFMALLRGHHLICLHFFNGEGYDAHFIDNLRVTLREIEAASVDICSGADAICRKCPFLVSDSCQSSNNADQVIRDMDRRALELLDLLVGSKADWNVIRKRLPSVFRDWYRAYCADCEWLTVCEQNAIFRGIAGGQSGS